ncbi:uncharacterized protein LACBIDRAFT_301569 [Laccaria bicolor S238N-H82]|uniref:Predicted protein n=1 Tax=Laccaria bicolor (strain S238N-H82 / ATCC MYA-4686) TaxID=486041 RepID=B0CNU7_LACBS|nr:uncharacterized protein LACBIDRAFT_301569 [Laccaria bicolor S238N-H82]EDR16004.1 predicted protein [Laccaria bicolor S238N-H82]|eukprot:XP_001874212.1 predicted protein [Laccaria bicolor S238N-H82]
MSAVGSQRRSVVPRPRKLYAHRTTCFKFHLDGECTMKGAVTEPTNSTPSLNCSGLQELRRKRRFVQDHRHSTASGDTSYLPMPSRFNAFVVPTVPPTQKADDVATVVLIGTQSSVLAPQAMFIRIESHHGTQQDLPTQKIMEFVEHHKNRLNAILQCLFPDILLESTYEQSQTRQGPIWQCDFYLDGVHIGTGGGITKQHASEGAAESAVEYLRRQYSEQYPRAFR